MNVHIYTISKSAFEVLYNMCFRKDANISNAKYKSQPSCREGNVERWQGAQGLSHAPDAVGQFSRSCKTRIRMMHA